MLKFYRSFFRCIDGYGRRVRNVAILVWNGFGKPRLGHLPLTTATPSQSLLSLQHNVIRGCEISSCLLLYCFQAFVRKHGLRYPFLIDEVHRHCRPPLRATEEHDSGGTRSCTSFYRPNNIDGSVLDKSCTLKSTQNPITVTLSDDNTVILPLYSSLNAAS